MVKSLIDPRKKAEVRRALASGDLSGILGPKRAVIQKPAPVVEAPTAKPIPINREQLDDLLMNAAEDGNKDEVVRLLKGGANVNNTSGALGTTPLMRAAREGHKEVVEVLVGARADLDAKDELGITALMKAVLNQGTEIVRLLVDAGANVNAKDNLGQSVLFRARMYKNEDIVELLKTHGAIE